MKGCLLMFIIGFTFLVWQSCQKMERRAAGLDLPAPPDPRLANRQAAFSKYLIKNTAVTSTHWLAKDLLWVTLKPEIYTTTENVETIARNIAFWWAGRMGLEYACVEVRFGKHRYAVGTYQGEVPPVYAMVHKDAPDEAEEAGEQPPQITPTAALDQLNTRVRQLPAIEAWTFDQVTGTHGQPTTTDKATGWAYWPTFKAQFKDGKVIYVYLP
jgi:hypothetical protein